MIKNYWYSEQLRSYMRQFMAIFNGLSVQTGVGECGVEDLVPVTCVVGTRDRVVAAITNGNTQNKLMALPLMAVHLQSIQLAPERRKVQAFVDQRTAMRTGGTFPDDLTVVKRAMPVPYNVVLELSIYASNTQQMHQILEQVLVMFNPDIQIQKNDAPYDWTRLTRVELTDITNEENYPSGADRRMVIWTLTFSMPIYLTIPMAVKDDLVRRVIIQIGLADSMNFREVDQNGEILPFGDPVGVIDIDSRPVPTEDECKYVGPVAPTTNLEFDDTWFNTQTGFAMRWNGIEWYKIEQKMPTPKGPDDDSPSVEVTP
jgi:hypothetical protein